jgi:hypothetical protein
MTVEQIYKANEFLNQDLPCVVAKSLQILSSESNPNISYLIAGFSDGRTLTMSINHCRIN